MPDPFYERRSLNVDIYAGRAAEMAVVDGDIDFYLELARRAPGPTLELGCGTGRVLLPLARAGIEITGIDLSEPMLKVARSALAEEPEDVRRRATLVPGDMRDFALEHTYGFIYIAFRSFQILPSPEAERECLTNLANHLLPGGIVAIDLFDPWLDRLTPESAALAPRPLPPGRHPETGNEVLVETLSRTNDPLTQTFEEVWQFTEVDRDGTVLRTEDESLRMRWLYRWEMRYLLELCGFVDIVEYSDFKKSPPTYGKELVFLARKA
jgi:SAM-dependent methyltransferase